MTIFKKIRKRGLFLVEILVFSGLFLLLITFIMVWAFSSVRIANRHNAQITSMSIAEAGLNYYLWHLSHDNTDYCNGSPCVGTAPYGPFTYTYKNNAGRDLGEYDLYITPPAPGNATTEVKSVGRINDSAISRTVIATIGMPSFTKYTLLVNNGELWVGEGEKITGSVFVNNDGVHVDGEITGDVSSTKSKYNSSMNLGNNLDGVNWNPVTAKFGGGKYWPANTINFNQVSVDMTTVRNEAKDQGKGDYYGASGGYGYHIYLSANSYTIKKVNDYYSNANSASHLSSNTSTETVVASNRAYPLNSGIIFCQDNVWVEGAINNKQLTIFAADPSAIADADKKRIIIQNNVLYSTRSGSDKIGLITQKDILVPRNAPNDLEIDAAMIAKEGEIKILPYGSEKKNKITVYGSIAHTTGLVWTYAQSNGTVVSGYRYTDTIVDQNNILQPPPKFPLTGSYAILSWREE